MWAVLGACCCDTLRCTAFASRCSAAAATEWGELERPKGQKRHFCVALLWECKALCAAAAAADAAEHPTFSAL